MFSVEMTMDPVSAAERKRKRLEAWRKRQKQTSPVPPPAPAVKVSLSLGGKKVKKRKTKPKKVEVSLNPFQDDVNDEDEQAQRPNQGARAMGFDLDNDEDDVAGDDSWGEPETLVGGKRPAPRHAGSSSSPTSGESANKKRKTSRWDNAPDNLSDHPPQVSSTNVEDALDKFMDKLQTGAMGSIATQETGGETGITLSVDVAGSMMRATAASQQLKPPPVSGGVITPEQLAQLGSAPSKRKASDALYSETDWESDAQGASAYETEDEDEERARQALIEALKSAPGPETAAEEVNDDEPDRPAQLAAEVKSEKNRREERRRQLKREAEAARAAAAKVPETGRLYNDVEGGVMEEAERYLDAAMAQPDALEVLAELNKKKELKAVDHSKVDYIPFKKNLYIVPRSLANLSTDEVADIRAKLKVKVRGQGAPAPVSSFQECGISERIASIMAKQEITTPFPVQAQCLPCIMAGRDVIGIAKTGSGKTLAYLLPMLR